MILRGFVFGYGFQVFAIFPQGVGGHVNTARCLVQRDPQSVYVAVHIVYSPTDIFQRAFIFAVLVNKISQRFEQYAVLLGLRHFLLRVFPCLALGFPERACVVFLFLPHLFEFFFFLVVSR